MQNLLPDLHWRIFKCLTLPIPNDLNQFWNILKINSLNVRYWWISIRLVETLRI